MEYEEPTSEVFIRTRDRKHTTAGTSNFASSDKGTDIQHSRISEIYSRLKFKRQEELRHEGADEDEEDSTFVKDTSQQITSGVPDKLSSHNRDNLVFKPKPNKNFRIGNFAAKKPLFTHSNIVDLGEDRLYKAVRSSIDSKFAGIKMVGDNTLDGDSLERQELTSLDPSGKKSILRSSHTGIQNVDEVEDASDVTYITRLDKDGNIEQVPSGCDETSDVNPNPMADFLSADILTKPFNFVSGSATKSRFNPFRKKSGLLNVLARQSTKNRIVAKNGTLNTTNEYHSTKFWKDIFITLIDINWGWIFALFASAFFTSWLLFAVIWYLTFLQHGDFDPANKDEEGNWIPPFVPCADNIKDFTSCFLFSLETQHTIGYGGR